MDFYDYALNIISQKLKDRNTLQKIINDIRKKSTDGLIAFYPCTRLTRVILNRIKETDADLLSKILGCFDRSKEANTVKGIPVYEIKELNKFKNKISLLVVAATNKFFDEELKDLKKFTNYDGNILKVSFFEISIQEELNDEKILEKIKETYNLLADEKSKMTYLTTWLSRMLNDENLTYLFESEDATNTDGEIFKYKDFLVEGLNDAEKKELHYEIYKMKYFIPEPNDIVFDIGAYVGDSSIFFSSYIGKKGKIYSFEPIKANFNLLLQNIELNNLKDVIIPINMGCADKSGFTGAISTKSGASWAFLSGNDGNERVELISIDDFVDSNDISKLDLIKIDAEGAEYNIILGAKETIERFKPKMVICLYHNTSDLFSIPPLVNKLSDYKLYVRCKTEGAFSVNLYCVPR